uniref:Elongator complex protein 6 n=1 Tax=Culicoides sonorensis TaxID=179676 RepID=A0A336ML72_CULSO
MKEAQKQINQLKHVIYQRNYQARKNSSKMTSNLLNATNLNVRPPQRFILIEENSKADGECLISAILGHRLSLESPGIVLVCAEHTFEHYNQVGNRWAHRISMHRDNGTIRPIEALKNHFEDFMDIDGKIDYLERFWHTIEKYLHEFKEMNKQNVSVIIDNLIFYKDLFEADEAWMVDICEKLYKLTNLYQNLSIVVKINESELYELLCRNIEDYANPIIQVDAFETGLFHEVDGKLIVKEKENVDEWVSKVSEKQLLFKITNRDIKIYVPGSVDLK